MSKAQAIAAAERIAAALGGRSNGKGGYRCLCPAHDDRHHPNLDVDLGANGKLLVNCTAGCTQTEVIEALRGLDLWPGSKPLTEAEKQQAAEATARRKEMKRQEQERAARQALEIYQAATGDPKTHPYTQAKGGLDFGPHVRRGAWPQRGWTDALIVPLYNAQGQITTLQAINSNLKDKKDFLRGGRKRGSFYPFGRFKDATGQVWIAEGLADTAAVHAVNGAPCVMAVDTGNLSVVAEVVREIAPEAEIGIMADDDAEEGKEGNPGIEAAIKAARLVNGKVAVPNMGKRADAWDLWREQGPEALRAALQNARPVDELVSEKLTVEGAHNASTLDTALDDAARTVHAAIERVQGDNPDPGAVFEPEVLDALRLLHKRDHAGFQRLRLKIKKASRDIRISDLDAALRGGEENEAGRETAATLVDMVRERCTLFHCPDNEPYGKIEQADHRECWHINSKGFEEWLAFEFYNLLGRVPGEKPLKAALATLAGIARFEGQERSVFMRVANHEGDVWLDLCDQQWRAVKITASSWSIEARPPVMFTRSEAMRALPEPEPGGDIAALWGIVNIPKEDRLIVLAWLLECLRTETPYPVLELTGEEGSAKSSTQHYLRETIDPNRANLRAAPKHVEDVFISARNAHLVSLNNLSYLKPEYQDALCCLATGGGYAGRTLYTNGEETVFDLKKPVMLNGIATLVTAQDLLGRTVHIDLPTIERRLSEVEIKEDFEQHKGAILGGLLDYFVQVLKLLPGVQIDEAKRPRMADFAHLGEAVYRVAGHEPGQFLDAYEDKRRDGVHRTLDGSPVAVACLNYLENVPQGFDGTVKGLFETVEQYRPEGETWPRSARGFADVFRRVAPAMRLIGINAGIGTKPGKYGYPCYLIPTPTYIFGGGKVAEQNSTSIPRPMGQTEKGEHGEQGERVLGNSPHADIYTTPSSDIYLRARVSSGEVNQVHPLGTDGTGNGKRTLAL